jgi:hypothetical protein
MDSVDILSQASDADVAEVTLSVSTGKGDAKNKTDFPARLPRSLDAAKKLFGDKKVFKLFTNALVVELQGVERAKLAPKGEEKGRKKAAYLESLGL